MAKEKTNKLQDAIKYYAVVASDDNATEEARKYATTALYYLRRYARYSVNKAEEEYLMNDNCKWTKEEEDQLKAEFEKGYSVERLAKVHHRKYSGIISRLVLLGLLSEEGTVKKRWTKEEEEKLEKEFLSGKKLAQIAKNHNRTIGGINSRLILLGLIDE